MMATILWVEDNLLDVELLRTAFQEIGIGTARFVVASNAIEAFRYIDRQSPFERTPIPPDLILVDLNLPAIRGTSVLREFRRHLPRVPTVVLTSSEDRAELAWCRMNGATECLTKPRVIAGYEALARALLTYLPRSGGFAASGGGDLPGDEPPSSAYERAGERRNSFDP
jgi:CheY-like chemotaxis protein